MRKAELSTISNYQSEIFANGVEVLNRRKRMMTKANVFLTLCVGLLFVGFINAQSCTMDSSFAPSNIDIPTRMETGQTARVRVNVLNSGTCIWQERNVKLSIKVIRKPSRAPYPLEEFKSELKLRNSVYPEKKHTWFYEITAPTYAGRYVLEWTMTNDGKPFGVQVRKTIEVNVP